MSTLFCRSSLLFFCSGLSFSEEFSWPLCDPTEQNLQQNIYIYIYIDHYSMIYLDRRSSTSSSLIVARVSFANFLAMKVSVIFKLRFLLFVFSFSFTCEMKNFNENVFLFLWSTTHMLRNCLIECKQIKVATEQQICFFLNQYSLNLYTPNCLLYALNSIQ